VNRWLTLAVLCLPLLIVSLDNTVLNVALPTLVRKLHASDSELQWIVDAYVLVFGGLMLVSGSVADRVGRKQTFLIGLAAFAVCSTWAALSTSAADRRDSRPRPRLATKVAGVRSAGDVEQSDHLARRLVPGRDHLRGGQEHDIAPLAGKVLGCLG